MRLRNDIERAQRAHHHERSIKMVGTAQVRLCPSYGTSRSLSLDAPSRTRSGARSRQPHIQQPPSFVLQELLHCAGGGDLALVGVGFVVLLDVVEPVEI